MSLKIKAQINAKKRKELAFLGAILLSFGLIFSSLLRVKAADTGTVTATVTVQNISVSVSDGTVTYGTLATSATEDTTTSGLDDSQTATNDGNVTEDFNIRGQNSANWTLGATAGADTYVHSFCTSNCDSSPTWTALTTSNQTLATGVAASGSQTFDLQIETPTSTTSYTEQSVDVTIQAVAN